MVHELLAAIVECEALRLNAAMCILPGVIGSWETVVLSLNGGFDTLFNDRRCLIIRAGLLVNECRLIGSWNGANNVNAV